MFEDVSERKAVEQQLRQAQKMRAIGELTGGMAHDFNNLLGVIVGSLDMLRERVTDDPESADLVEEAMTGGLRGARLTKRMLAFAPRPPPHPHSLNLHRTLRDLTHIFPPT